MTQFEDLANEILYEIFDYLDDIYVYETFSYFNNRFYQLVNQSLLPLRISLSYESLANFNNHFQNILLAHKHRLQSLHVSDYFFHKRFLFDSSLIRLESIYFENIQHSALISTLTTCTQLPCLYYLTFNCIEQVKNPDEIYLLIFSFPALKSCQLSLNTIDQEYQFSFENFSISSIERLTINSKTNLKNLVELLAFAPNLSHLSCRISSSFSSNMLVVNKNLTNLALTFNEASFDEVEWFIQNLSSPIRNLTISTKHDREFLNADRWQRILTEQIPSIRKFALEVYNRQTEVFGTDEFYHSLIEQFNSSFWREKQWFFAHQHYTKEYSRRWIRFYSIKPYKWKKHRFDGNQCPYFESGLHSAFEIDLHHYECIPYRFPRATRLILSEGDLHHLSNIYSCFSCQQITELIIANDQFRLEHLFSLINHFPNLQNLTIQSDNLTLDSPQSEIHPVRFPLNQINKITISNQCTLQDVLIVQRVCPLVRSLDIEMNNEQIESTFNVLLSQRARRKNVLSNVCFREIQFGFVRKFRTLIEHNRLIRDFSIHYFDQKIFLWYT